MSRRQLILYAWPSGPLADALDGYFAAATAMYGATTAQTYPVHCTLTGFFWRSADRATDVLRALGRTVCAAGEPPVRAVTVDGFGVRDGWVGLELRSPWLLALVDAVVGADRPGPGEDHLRPKDWLHVSLAYGIEDVSPYVDLARRTVDPSLPAVWHVGFWERRPDGSWYQHTSP